MWRYRYDQFGWTTRSSELYESRLLRIGSPLFHFPLRQPGRAPRPRHRAGHPQSWTTAAGLSQKAYHVQALVLGGIATLAGAAILIYRRRTTGPVFMATTRNDKAMYVVLVAAIVAGLATTLLGAGVVGNEHNYRESVSPWFRSVFVLQPDIDAMDAAPLSFQLHTLIGMLLFAVWPFTRLVHAFTAPVGYLFRPYIVYRSRATGTTARPPRRGWEQPGPLDAMTRSRRRIWLLHPVAVTVRGVAVLRVLGRLCLGRDDGGLDTTLHAELGQQA